MVMALKYQDIWAMISYPLAKPQLRQITPFYLQLNLMLHMTIPVCMAL